MEKLLTTLDIAPEYNVLYGKTRMMWLSDREKKFEDMND